MIREIGQVKAIYRYPIKSMAGQQLKSASLGWHGFNGDRRFAFMRIGVESGFPWLTASKLPQLVKYSPLWNGTNESTDIPTHIQTPTGQVLELRSENIEQDISQAHGSPVKLIQLNQGIFDEANISVISQATITSIEKETKMRLETARFRPNILIETLAGKPFEEDEWVGKTMWIGEGESSTAINIYMQDARCVMINIHPITGETTADILKTVVRMNANNAGVYATVIKPGVVSVGDKLFVDDI